jgi:hypothetical protein
VILPEGSKGTDKIGQPRQWLWAGLDSSGRSRRAKEGRHGNQGPWGQRRGANEEGRRRGWATILSELYLFQLGPASISELVRVCGSARGPRTVPCTTSRIENLVIVQQENYYVTKASKKLEGDKSPCKTSQTLEH